MMTVEVIMMNIMQKLTLFVSPGDCEHSTIA